MGRYWRTYSCLRHLNLSCAQPVLPAGKFIMELLANSIERFSRYDLSSSALFLAELLLRLRAPCCDGDFMSYIHLLMKSQQHRRALHAMDHAPSGLKKQKEFLLCRAQCFVCRDFRFCFGTHNLQCECKEWAECVQALSSIEPVPLDCPPPASSAEDSSLMVSPALVPAGV